MITPRPFWLALVVCIARLEINSSFGQVEVLDQDGAKYGGEGGFQIDGYQQSFTPSVSAISFVEFGFSDHLPGNGIGSDIYVNLRQTSPAGLILGRTTIVKVPDGARGLTKFEFSHNIPLLPETLYFLEPVRVSGDAVYSKYGIYYRGSRYYNGQKGPNSMVFREGFQKAEITSLLITNSVLNISWRGVGILQTASGVFGPWIEFADRTNGTEQIDLNAYGISTNGVHIFRVRD
jgi:hypothetical protein